jgi:hypothetical protein
MVLWFLVYLSVEENIWVRRSSLETEKERLADALTQSGHPPIELAGSNGSSVLVLPYGARILGLFPDGASNLLWTNPQLAHAKTAAAFFNTAGWRNTGGGRTWISPERDIHVVDLEDPWNSYRVTESIDPGSFSVVRTDEKVQLDTAGVATHHRTGQQCRVHLEKIVRLVPNPLRYGPGTRDLLKDVAYAGYEQITSLTYSEDHVNSAPQLSLFDAVNLPATGKIFIPTVKRVQPTDFFETTGPSHLTSASCGLSFLFDGLERHKIAIRVSDVLGGRAGYLREISKGEFSLLVRNFFVEPSADYVDTPWNDPEDRGYVLDCYNDGGINGLYGELEYHSPAMGPGSGRSQCVDRAQLWGFQGQREKILNIMGQLLGEGITKELVE